MKTQRFQAWVAIALTALVLGVFAPAPAAACPDMSGKVVKVKTSYWLVRDGQRYEFVDLAAMQTWDKTPVTVKAECVKDLPVVGFINYRPGSRLVKKAGEPTVYAVGPQMMLHPVDAAAARQWYGANWKSLVKTLPADKFAKFTVDVPLSLDRLNDGALVRAANKPQVYYVKGGLLVKVEGKLRPALSGKVLVLPVKVFVKLQVTTGTIKAADIVAEPVTATVLVQESAAPVAPVTPPNTPVTPGTDPVVTPPVSGSNPVITELLKLPRHNANYNGPFPAPEGMVLEGTLGDTIYFEPTGSGEYRFRPVLADGGLSINCLDSTRRVRGSKGANYDAGFESGVVYGMNDYYKILVPYNDTPRGAGALTNQYFKEGFKAGYKWGFDSGRATEYRYYCKVDAESKDNYDADGWRKTAGFRTAPNLKAVYYPATAGGYVGGDGKTAEETYKWKINSAASEQKPEQDPLNAGKAAVNLSEITITEVVPEGAEVSMSMQDLAKAMYDQTIQLMNTKFKNICSVTEPTYETKTFGANTVTSLGYVQVCQQGTTVTWTLQTSSFIKGKTSGHILLINYVNPHNLKKAGANELDESKLYSVPFIQQFLNKIQFN